MSDSETHPTGAAHTEHLRPRHHFTPATTWINDPNGLVHYDGTYHMFFQNNPHGSAWSNMSWGHATSPDLLTWTEHDVAIRCTEDEEIYSGSVVVDHHNTSGFAAPGQTPLVAVYTSHYGAGSTRHGTQAQSLAWSVDSGTTWTVASEVNPVLCRRSPHFRDPKVFWFGPGGHWVLVAVEAEEHYVVLYRSADLRSWTELSALGPFVGSTGPWECPDLFELPVAGSDESRWVLLVSVGSGGPAGGNGTQYLVGDFDGTRFTPVNGPEGGWRWLDRGPDFYAAVSFDNVTDRRLLVAWVNNWAYAVHTPTAPWRSSMSLVREVELVRMPSGRLLVRQQPVVPHEGLVSVSDRLPIEPGRRAVVTFTTDRGLDPLVVGVDGDTRHLVLDRGATGDSSFHPDFVTEIRAPLETQDLDVDVQIVIDGGIVEVYAEGGLTVLTAQIFPRAPLTKVRVATE